MSTIDQAQIGESPPAKDRCPNHWDMPPANVQRFAINGIKVWRSVNFCRPTRAGRSLSRINRDSIFGSQLRTTLVFGSLTTKTKSSRNTCA